MATKKKQPAKATTSSRVKTAKKLLDEGKLKPGHVRRLGVRKQAPGKYTANDREINAMLPGYRVSKNGNLYYENRVDRSDTPKQLGMKQTQRARTWGEKNLPKAKQHDKYQAPRTPVIRKPKIQPKVYRKKHGRFGDDNRLVDVLEGHWFDSRYEYQVLEAKDGDTKGFFFVWKRELPPWSRPEQRFNPPKQWALMVDFPLGDTLEKAISNFEKVYDVKYVTGVSGRDFSNRVFKMTSGMYNYLEKLHRVIRPEPATQKQLITIMRRYERKICTFTDHEEIIGISEFGDVLYQSVGGSGSCRLPMWADLMSKIDTHNHPGSNGWKGPSTFSLKTSLTNSKGGDWEAYRSRLSYMADIHRTCSFGVAFTLYIRKATTEMHSKLVKRIEEEYGAVRKTEKYQKGSEGEKYGMMCTTIRRVFKEVLPKEVYHEEKL